MQDSKSKVMDLVNSGNLPEARRVCLKACKSAPSNVEMWFILSAICGQQNDYKGAEQYSKKVLKLNPGNPSVYYNLAVAQRGLGKINDAVSSHKKALALKPDFSPSLYELGNIYLESNEYAKSIELYDIAIKSQPDSFQVHTAKAKALYASGSVNAAMDSYEKSLRINSAQHDVYIGLAKLYEDTNEIGNAIKYNEMAVNHGYKGDDVYINLARLYSEIEDYQKSEELYRAFLLQQPDNTVALIGLALLYDKLCRSKDALEIINKVKKADLNNNIALYNYALILASNFRFSESIEFYKKSLECQPDFVEAMINLGNIYLLCGNVKEARDIYEKACNFAPDNQNAVSNLLMSMNYTDDVTHTECISMHCKWAPDQSPTSIDFRERPTNAKLRVGYVSSDFVKQSVAYFFDALLRFSDSERIENYCYSNSIIKDEVTELFKNMSDSWLDVYNISDEDLSKRIVEDNIDVLVDLSGHTAGNRLRVFAMKPAPVQITYLGYPNTTGLDTIDYRIVDKYTDPEDDVAEIPEKKLYMQPSFLCYKPLTDYPDVSELPSKVNDHITFGSFNNLAKITDSVFDVWSDLLKQVPDSKLCIKARQYSDADIRSAHIAQFIRRGVDGERIVLIHYTETIHQHLECYSGVDIALDTFPYNGTTTTIEALWMGVPVVTISGHCHAGRVGVSILNNINKSEWIAKNTSEYVNIAKNISRDRSKLENIRKTLREEVRSSPLCDGNSFTKMFEDTLLDVSK